MPDDDFDTTTEEGKLRVREAIQQSARRFDPALQRPLGGAKGGIGKGRVLHKGIIHSIK